MNLKDFLNGLAIPSGRTRRIDCPGCGGSNSLSVTNNSGVLVYNCFRASCPVHGATEGRFTLEDAMDSFEKLSNRSAIPERKNVSFEIPSYFRPLGGEVERYLDVKENRTVYIVRDYNGKALDAAGRTNVKGVKPKWKRYNNSEHPYVAGPWSGIAVIVEDCISAEAVKRTTEYTGVGLLGTNIGSCIARLSPWFNGFIVALDYDATNKAVDLVRRMTWTKPTVCVMLKEDLKYFKSEEIKEQLKEARVSLLNV